MSNFNVRKKLFEALSTHRKRTLVSLITSDKKPAELFSTQIAGDTLPLFYDLLNSMDRDEGLDLLIHSTGGQIDVAWPLINLIREYFNDVNIIVPWRAQSAATLICLGANGIGMSPLASLSPIDPQFQQKLSDKQVTNAGVEDIYGYYRLITDTLNLDSDGRSEALKLLSTRVSPEILGKITRVRREIRIVASNLLSIHMSDVEVIEKIVKALVEELPSHQYLINRSEAANMGLPVFNLDEETEKTGLSIVNSYVKETKMDEPGLSINFGSEALVNIEMNRAFVETKDRSYAFISKYTFHRDGKVDRVGDKWQEVK